MIWPSPNTVQIVSQFLIDLGEAGRYNYFLCQLISVYALFLLTFYSNAKEFFTTSNRKLWAVEKILVSDYTFIFFALIFISLARIPSAVYAIQNPDEPMWIACAKTLSKDPRIFVSVDTGTGGPIVPLFLIPLKLIGLSIDSGSVKIMSGGLLCLSAICLFRVGRIAGSAIARLTILPVIIAISAMKSPDMIAYNSEHPSIFLLSIALVFFYKLYISGPGRYSINLFLLGMILGLVPFSKLQATPMAFFIGLVSLYIVYKEYSTRHLLILGTSALMPTLLVLFMLWTYNGLNDFWVSYVQNNLFYSTAGQSGFMQRMDVLLEIVFSPTELNFYWIFLFVSILINLFLIIFFGRRVRKKTFYEILFIVILLIISAFCVAMPGRNFVHYTLFLLFPFTALLVVSSHCVNNFVFTNNVDSLFGHIGIKLSFVMIMLIASIYYFHSNFTFRPEYLEKANRYYNGYTPTGELSAVLSHYFEPGARIATWAYEPELFEGNSFLMGTRFATFVLPTGPYYKYYLDTYINDLKVNRPKLFVESFYRSSFRFEDVPEVKEYINTNYTFHSEIVGNNIYVRNGDLPHLKPWTTKSSIPISVTSEFHISATKPTRSGSFIIFYGWAVLGNNSDDQKVSTILISKSDTLCAKCFQSANKSVVDFSPNNKNNLMCGFTCFIPFKEVGLKDYQIGMLIENQNTTGFKVVGLFNAFSLLNKE
ncbi:MAG: hypothetical protein K2U26_14185 [Cyclobacteriaceae bacterium]|nr:hypothetical protein [Cyclobacteriaceae bacterium]